MKLLNKSIRQLAQYALVVFLVCVPLFYFIIEQLYIQDVDDALYLKRDELRLRAGHLRTSADITLWLAMDDDVRIAPLSRPPIRDSLYFTQYLDSLPQEMEPYRELVSSIVIQDKTYTLTLRASLLESRDLIIGIAEAQAILLLLLLAGWVLLIRFRSKKTWRPFYHTIRQLQQYELNGGLLPVFEPTDIEEFQVLNTAIAELVNRNQQVYVSQMTFIENASHEMQTPLAIFRSKLDNMIETRPLSRDESADFQILYEAVQRLYRLNRGLLLLSKIGNHQFPDTSEISVVAATQRAVNFLQEMIDSSEICLHLDLSEDTLITANDVLLQTMITNLLTNAIQHNRPGGAVIVTLEGGELTIANSGSPLPFPEEELYTRFKKHASPRKGVGLGLSVVKEVANHYSLPIHYVYEGEFHRFSILFNPSKAII